MATGVRFTQPERELIRKQLGKPEDWCNREAKLITSILSKLEKSELTKVQATTPGIGWVVAAATMREVLGATLATPPHPDPVWMMKMNNRIRTLGLSVQDCKSIAKVLWAKQWRVYSFEKTIWNADTLLAEAQLDIPPTRGPDRRPMQMDDF